MDISLQKRFWKKKTIATYVLSVMVLLLHLSTFANYNGLIIGGVNVNEVFHVLFQKTLVRAAVPAFFIISGALFFRDYTDSLYANKLGKRIKTLVIPYIIWNTVWMLFNIAISYTFISDYFVAREKYVITIPNILLGVFHYKGCPALWFVFDLIFFVLISPLINKLLSRKWLGIVSIMALISMSQLGVELPEAIFFDGSAIIYYLTGAMIGKYCMGWFLRKSPRRDVIISSVICVASIVCLYAEFYERLVLPRAAKIIILGVTALSLWILMDPLADRVRHFEQMKESFMVYVLHGNINSIVTKVFFLLLPSSAYFAIPNYILSAASVLVIIHAFCYLLRKYAKSAYCVVSGFRNT